LICQPDFSFSSEGKARDFALCINRGGHGLKVYVKGLLKESDSRQKGKGEGLLSRRYKLSQASSACPIRSSIFDGLDQSSGRLRRIPEDPCISFVR
jgi:hypothetical protein